MPFYSLDLDQFRLTLFEFMIGAVPLILIRIDKLSWSLILCFVNPIKILVFGSKDSDPDVRVYLENYSCEYDTDDSFNNMLAENQIRLNLKCMQLSWNWPFPPYEHSSYI